MASTSISLHLEPGDMNLHVAHTKLGTHDGRTRVGVMISTDAADIAVYAEDPWQAQTIADAFQAAADEMKAAR